MANGIQKGDDNLASFQEWVATQSNDDFKQIIYRGALNRAEIAKAIGCGKSALKQNPALKMALTILEDSLREKGVLPPLTDQGKKAQEGKAQAYDHTKTKRIMESKRLSALETENLSLKAELAELKRSMERMGELSATLAELGLVPR
jgi:hypothetical protein